MAIIKRSQSKIQVIDETADLTEEQVKKAAEVVKKYKKEAKEEKADKELN